MNKTIIIPIVAAFALFFKLVLKIDINEDLQAQIVDWLSAGAGLIIVLYGIWKNHKRVKPPESK